MDIAWGSNEAWKFVTNVGLITSDGPHGPNVMAAEWTHQVSYSPGLIIVSIGHKKATLENIKKTKEFGVNIAAADQNMASSVAGGSSGRDTDKIKVLEEMGVEFYKASKISVLMIKGAVLNAECKVVKIEEMGDHTMVLGEVVALSSINKEPLAYNGGKYLKLGEQITKPSQEARENMRKIVEKHRKK